MLDEAKELWLETPMEEYIPIPKPMGVDLKLMGFERCKVGRPSGIRHETLSKNHAAREVTHASG